MEASGIDLSETEQNTFVAIWHRMYFTPCYKCHKSDISRIQLVKEAIVVQ